MKPIRLTFTGIRSYRSQAEVDFTDLDLFAIIGDTGAGKSTILEALTFALYARKTWAGGSLDELIADGEKRLVVELRFAADGDEWTVTRTRNRNSTSGADKLVNTEGSVKVDGARAVTDKITELLGLNFDQFTRAVLMPQGRFDELLKATSTERTKILTSILGLDELRVVRESAEAMARSWQEPVVEARTERRLLPLDPAASVAALVAQVTQAEAARESLAAASARASAAERDVGSASGAAATLRTALRLLPAVDAHEALASLRQLEGLGTELLAARREAQERRTAAEATMAEVAAEQTTLLRGLADRDAVVTLRARLRSIGDQLGPLTDRLADAEQALQQLVESAPPDGAPAELTSALATATAARSAADSAARAAAERLSAAVQRHAELTAARQRLVDAEALVGAAVARRDEAQQLAGERAAEVVRTEAAAADARHAHDSAKQADLVATLTSHLHAGDDCPVCARSLPATWTAPAAPELAVASEAVEATRVAHQAAITAAASAAATATQADRAAAQAQADVAAAESAVRAAEAEAGDIAEHDEAARAATVALEVAVQAETEARRAVDEASAELVRLRATYEADLKHRTKERDDLVGAVAQLHESAAAGPAEWRPVAPLTTATITETVAALDETTTALTDVAARQQEHVEAIQVATRAIAEVDQRGTEEVVQPASEIIGSINRRLERCADLAAATASDPPTPITDPVRTATLPTIIEAAAAALAEADVVADRAGAALADAEAQVARHQATIDTALAASGHATIGELQAAAGAAELQATTSRAELAAAEGAAERAAALDAVLDIGEPFLANLGVLAHALRDSAFVRHLVNSREAELLAEATRRLRTISNNRFGFVADFGVANLASGEIRTPEALSGGERFQAALALALGLVEIASRGAGRLEAVFVDEGFGSLDARSLDMALATLASVAGGGKTVALISHLRPVAEYVETVLQVQRDDVLGSRIVRLDADARDQLLADDIRSGLTA